MHPPSDYSEKYLLAQQAHKSGQLDQARSLYHQLTQTFPSQADPFHMLALIDSSQKQYVSAIGLFERAISLSPNNPLYRNNIAEALQRLGQDEKALFHLQAALKADPAFYLGKQKLASVLKKLQQYDPAEQLFNEVIEQKPDFEPAYFQLGTLKTQTGRFRSAIVQLKKAVSLNPKSHMAYNNLGVCHQELDEMDEAIVSYQAALAIAPDYEDSLRNLALIHDKIGRVDESKKYFKLLAAVRGNDPLIHWTAELVGKTVYSSNEEIDAYRKKVTDELLKIKGRNFKIDVEQLVKLDIHPPSALIYQGRDDRPIKSAYADLFKGIPKLKLSEFKNEKPHVVFLVTNGHEGVFVKCMAGILNQISTEKFRVSVACSFPNGEKIIRPAITSPEVRFIKLPKSLGDSVKLLVSENIDFLHYWEIGTDAYNYFLPYFKPARFQATSWGWPVTSGNPNVDFFISSEGLDTEPNKDHYSEKLILFKKLPVYYYPPKPPAMTQSKSDLGLPENSNLYCCVQNVKKIHPDFDALLRGILEKDPDGTIVLTGDKYATITDQLTRRMEKNLGSHFERVKVLPRLENDDYFNLLQLSSVVLDTVHYTGGANTNYDAFEVGTPVVTLPGDYHRSRYTAAAYAQLGFMHLVADSDQAYIDLAVRIAQDQKFRNQMVEKIKTHKHRLFEDQEAVNELENFILDVLSTNHA